MRRRVTGEEIRLAKAVDLITYMKQYEPQELIRTGPHDYKTATHSSLCISDNGLWHWFSHDIGGRGALNYLIQVKGMDYPAARWNGGTERNSKKCWKGWRHKVRHT